MNHLTPLFGYLPFSQKHLIVLVLCYVHKKSERVVFLASCVDFGNNALK